MTPYLISPRAQNDLDEIWDYIANDSPTAAHRLLELFRQKFLLLSSQPLLGEARRQLAADLRSFCVGNYVVLYRTIENGVEIARVIHAARDIGSQF